DTLPISLTAAQRHPTHCWTAARRSTPPTPRRAHRPTNAAYGAPRERAATSVHSIVSAGGGRSAARAALLRRAERRISLTTTGARQLAAPLLASLVFSVTD